MRRRAFLQGMALTPALLRLAGASVEPQVPPWSAAGDVTSDQAKLVVGGMGEGRLTVRWRAGGKEGKVVGDLATPKTGFAAQAELNEMPAGTLIRYEATIGSRSLRGQFRTAPDSADKKVRFLWGGDVVGQGWGIDPSRGGMLTFRTMLQERPDFMIHCGDSIYADDVLPPAKQLPNGEVWHNIITNSKSKAAETLEDFHGAYHYNFLDKHYREFFKKVPVIVQWDDHEVLNNWNPADHASLGQLGYEAFLNSWPVRHQNERRLYRKVGYGPNVDVFVLDLRNHRAPNGQNRQKEPGADTALLGREQLDWFKAELAASKATWKIVAGEMPLATLSPTFGLDNWSNGDGPPLGREFELAEILSFLKRNDIGNVVWLSADVHYAMAVHFTPSRARFKDFLPFWEFIAGPLHAGTFCPQMDLDPTFGPEEVFCSVPRDLPPARPPSEDLQFYGKVQADAKRLKVSLHNRRGKQIFEQELLN